MKYFETKMTYPQFLKYLVPSVLTMIFLSFYTTIDGYFVSRYAGSDALAGINIVIPITCVIFGTSVMLATGAGAIIGEKLGQKREREANEIFTFISIVLLILSIIFTIAGISFNPTSLAAFIRLCPESISYPPSISCTITGLRIPCSLTLATISSKRSPSYR